VNVVIRQQVPVITTNVVRVVMIGTVPDIPSFVSIKDFTLKLVSTQGGSLSIGFEWEHPLMRSRPTFGRMSA